MATLVSSPARRRIMSPQALRNLLNGILFTFPALIGLIAFTIYPVISSFYYSFHEYNAFPGKVPEFIGLQNYTDLLFDDPIFWKSLYNTIYMVIFSVPLRTVVAFLLALLLNTGVRGLTIYRTIFYLPSIVPLVATSMLWLWLFNPQYGILNAILNFFGLPGIGWLTDPDLAKPSLILMSVWGVGGTVIIFLAGLQDVPKELHEAAQIDGAGIWARMLNVTVPFMSPYVLFSVIIGLIGGFQYFVEVYVMTGGGPNQATNVYANYLYQNAFQYFKMGYASAMAWLLFIIIVVFTAIVFRSSARRVYYGGS